MDHTQRPVDGCIGVVRVFDSGMKVKKTERHERKQPNVESDMRLGSQNSNQMPAEPTNGAPCTTLLRVLCSPNFALFRSAEEP